MLSIIVASSLIITQGCRSFFPAVLQETALAPKAVVFDWGNVIGFNDRSLVVDFMCNSFNLSKSEFELTNLEKQKAIKAGESNDIDFWLKFAQKKGIKLPDDWPQNYLATIKKSIGANPNMYLLIDQLKKNGIRVGMLSNIDDRWAKWIRDFGFYEPFEPCLLSYEIGLKKPDPKAYELLLKTLDLPAEKIVFIDDLEENVTAAKAMGIDAILFISESQLRDELKSRKALR